MKVYISNDLQKEIVDLYLSGKSIRKIIKLKNISYYLINKYLKLNNIIISKRKTNKQQEKEICELYISGLSIAKISKQTNLGKRVIFNVLHRNAIETRINNTIYSLNQDYFKQIDSWEKAYILGFIYADGTVSKESNIFGLGQIESDKYILEKINQCLESNRPLYLKKSKSKNSKDFSSLKINNKVFYQHLVNQGVIPRKTFVISFPKLPNNLISAFILGYFDGDGYFSIDKRKKSTGYFGFCSNTNFCLEMQQILKSFNINSYVYIRKTRNPKSAELRVGKFEELEKLYRLLYSNASIFLIRKKEKIEELIRRKKL